MAVPHFEEIGPLTGFDAGADPPWQIVGVNFTIQAKLVDGAGWLLTSDDPSVTIVEESFSSIGDNPRFFELRGITRGVAHILGEPPGGGASIRLLEVEAKEELPLKIAFQFVEDNSFNKTTRLMVPGFMSQLRSSIIRIFFLQALVRLRVTREVDVQVRTSLRDVIGRQDRTDLAETGWLRGPYHEWGKLVGAGDPSAPLNIFFIPRSILIKENQLPPLIFGMDGNIVVEDDPLMRNDKLERDLAHWIGFTLGCRRLSNPRRANLLMSRLGDASARFIPKGCANIMNPTV